MSFKSTSHYAENAPIVLFRLPFRKQSNVIELQATTVARLMFNYDLESILPLGFKLPVFYRPPRPPGARPGAGRFAQELLQEL